MRLLSARVLMLFLPPSVVCYGWVIEKHVNVAAVCVFLFLSGFFSMYAPFLSFPATKADYMRARSVYSSTLAYIVDANAGRSSTAVALNSSFRGTFSFVIIEVAAPLQASQATSLAASLHGGNV